jgi:hypothetical protein
MIIPRTNLSAQFIKSQVAYKHKSVHSVETGSYRTEISEVRGFILGLFLPEHQAKSLIKKLDEFESAIRDTRFLTAEEIINSFDQSTTNPLNIKPDEITIQRYLQEILNQESKS